MEVRIWRVRVKSYIGSAIACAKAQGQPDCQVRAQVALSFWAELCSGGSIPKKRVDPYQILALRNLQSTR